MVRKTKQKMAIVLLMLNILNIVLPVVYANKVNAFSLGMFDDVNDLVESFTEDLTIENENIEEQLLDDYLNGLAENLKEDNNLDINDLILDLTEDKNSLESFLENEEFLSTLEKVEVDSEGFYIVDNYINMEIGETFDILNNLSTEILIDKIDITNNDIFELSDNVVTAIETGYSKITITDIEGYYEEFFVFIGISPEDFWKFVEEEIYKIIGEDLLSDLEQLLEENFNLEEYLDIIFDAILGDLAEYFSLEIEEIKNMINQLFEYIIKYDELKEILLSYDVAVDCNSYVRKDNNYYTKCSALLKQSGEEIATIDLDLNFVDLYELGNYSDKEILEFFEAEIINIYNKLLSFDKDTLIDINGQLTEFLEQFSILEYFIIDINIDDIIKYESGNIIFIPGTGDFSIESTDGSLFITAKINILENELEEEEEEEPSVAYILGDLNEDGKVNISDLIVLRQYLAGLIKLNEVAYINADLNNDGKVNISDLIKLRQYLAGVGSI